MTRVEKITLITVLLQDGSKFEVTKWWRDTYNHLHMMRKQNEDGLALQQIVTSQPFTIIETTVMSCGHKLESYRVEDNGEAGDHRSCIECEAGVPVKTPSGTVIH